LLPEFGEEKIVTTIKIVTKIKTAQDGIPYCWNMVDMDPKYKNRDLTRNMVSEMKDDFKTRFNSYRM